MAGPVEVRIIASDGASQTFKAIGGAAKSAGDDIQQMGDAGTKSFAELSSEITTVGTAMTGIGAIVTGSVVGPMVAGAKAAFDQVGAVEQATFALGAYGDSAEEVNTALQDLTAYAQDASRSGGIFWSEDLYAAAQNLVVMGAELENVSEYVQIMSRSIGLGASSWDELGVVIGRVISTGRLAGNEFDELSKAGFRLDESLRNTDISAQQLFDALDRGIPADSILGQADTISGRLAYLQGALIDVGQAALGVNDDLTFVAGGLGDQITQGFTTAREVLLSMVPAAEAAGNVAATAAGGFTTLVEAALTLPQPVQTAIFGLTGLTGAATLASGAFLVMLPRIVETRAALQALGGATGVMRLLATAINPVTLGLTAIVGVGSLVVSSWMEQKQAAQEYDASLSTLSDTMEQIRRQGDDVLAESIGNAGVLINDLKNSIADYSVAVDQMPQPEDFTGPDRDVEYGLALSAIEEQIAAVTEQANLATPAMAALNSAMSDPAVDADAYIMWANDLLSAAEATDTVADDIDALNAIIATQNEMPTEFLTAYAEGTDDVTTAIDRRIAAQRSALEIMADMEQADREALAWETERERTAHANREISLEGRREMADQLTAILEDEMAKIEEFNARRDELLQRGLELGGLDTATAEASLRGLSDGAAELAQNLTATGIALDNTFRIIVGNTNAIGQQMQGLEDWALELINIEGHYGQIDDLLADGLITLEQYNAAQQAQIEISSANAEVQDRLLAIQAMQAPLLGELAQRQADYVTELAGASEEQQLLALGWMDSVTAAQALEAQSLITAAAMGEMGPAGREATQGFIEGAIAANPVLEALLTDLELVSRDHEGNLVIHFDGAEGVRSDIDLLNESVRTLTDLLDDGEINGSIGIQVEGKEEADQTMVDLQNFDGTTATATLAVQAGNASVGDGTGGASNWRDMLGLPPEGTTETIDVITSVIGGEEITQLSDQVAGLEDATVNITADVAGFEELGSLFEMIRELGSTTTTVTVNIEADTSGLAGLGNLGIYPGGNESGGAAAIESPTVTVMFEADTSAVDDWTPPEISPVSVTVTGDSSDAMSAISVVNSAMLGLDGDNAHITVTGEDNASGHIGEVQGTLDALNGDNAHVTMTGDNSDAMSSISVANQALVGLDGDNAHVTITATDYASSVISGVINSLNSIPDSRSTTIYANRVNTTTNRVINAGGGSGFMALGGTIWDEMPPPSRWGVVPTAANGRSVWVGEAGPELVTLPHGSQVTPHVASMSRAEGGGEINLGGIHIHGNVYGIDDLTEKVLHEAGPAILAAKRRLERGLGVV